MQRDLNLVRQILLAIEADNGERQIRLAIEGFTEHQIDYHLGLMDSAGLIDVIDTKVLRGSRYIPQRLTWAGHEFLDAARDDKIWKKAVTKVGGVVGSATLDVMKDVLIALAKEALGLKG